MSVPGVHYVGYEPRWLGINHAFSDWIFFGLIYLLKFRDEVSRIEPLSSSCMSLKAINVGK